MFKNFADQKPSWNRKFLLRPLSVLPLILVIAGIYDWNFSTARAVSLIESANSPAEERAAFHFASTRTNIESLRFFNNAGTETYPQKTGRYTDAHTVELRWRNGSTARSPVHDPKNLTMLMGE